MILGEFSRKLNKASGHLRQKEPFTPWSNAAKREIKELKKDSSWKLTKFGTLKRLWNNCLELESYIRSNNAHGINKLDGEVPKTIMSGEMSDTARFVTLSRLNGWCFKMKLPYILMTNSDLVDTWAQELILVLPWWQRLSKRTVRSSIGPS